MKVTRKRLLLIAPPLSVIACCLIVFGLVKASFSPGVPEGACSVKGLLLDQSAFPAGTLREAPPGPRWTTDGSPGPLFL